MTIQDLRMVLYDDDPIVICDVSKDVGDEVIYRGKVEGITNDILNLTVLRLIPYIQLGATPIMNTAVLSVYAVAKEEWV